MPYRVFAGPTFAPAPHTRIFLRLRDHGAQAVDELGAALGLPENLVQEPVDELVETGLADGPTLGGPYPSSERLYRFRAEAGVVAAVDMDQHELRLAISDLGGNVVHRSHETSAPTVEPSARIDTITDVVRSGLADAGLPVQSLLAVSVGVPGHIDRDGRVGPSPVIPRWDGVDLMGELTARLGCPVHLFNDGTMASVAEAFLGFGAIDSDFLGDFVTVCLGRRLCVRQVIDRRPYTGVDRMAGRVAHLFGDRFDTFGQIAWQVDEDGDVVLDRALAGDQSAIDEIHEVISGLAGGIAQMVLLTNPDVVVLGGSIASRLTPWRDAITTAVLRQIDDDGVRLDLRFSPLAGDGSIAGLLVMALELATSALMDESVPPPHPDAWTPLRER